MNRRILALTTATLFVLLHQGQLLPAHERSETLSRILSGAWRLVQTVSDVYLERICSLDNASSERGSGARAGVLDANRAT